MDKKIWVVGMGLFLITAKGWADGPGTTAANILKVGVGARAIGMGEAFTATADDVSSLYWNPAGMGFLNQSQASFMYNPGFQDMNYNHTGVGIALENGGLGGSLSYLGFGNIEGFDATGNPTGNVNAYSGVATFGGGLILDPWTLGMNLKLVRATLADVSATGAAVDMGTAYVYPEPILGDSTLRFGAVVRNLGPGMKFLDQRDPMPTEVRAGTSLMEMFNRRVNLGLDFGKTRGEKSALYAGGEWRVFHMLALRSGYTHTDAEGNGLRAGLGLRMGDLSFDYAFASYGDLGLTHRYELIYRFGEIKPRLTPEERKMLRQAKLEMRRQNFGRAVLLLDSLVRMEPKYPLFRKLYKTAMRGDEQQEKLAQGERTFDRNIPHNSKVMATLPDLEDLENLLVVSEQAEAGVAMGAKK